MLLQADVCSLSIRKCCNRWDRLRPGRARSLCLLTERPMLRSACLSGSETETEFTIPATAYCSVAISLVRQCEKKICRDSPWAQDGQQQQQQLLQKVTSLDPTTSIRVAHPGAIRFARTNCIWGQGIPYLQTLSCRKAFTFLPSLFIAHM